MTRRARPSPIARMLCRLLAVPLAVVPGFLLISLISFGNAVAQPPVEVNWEAIGGPPADAGGGAALGPDGALYLSPGAVAPPARAPRSRLHVEPPPRAARAPQRTAREAPRLSRAPDTPTPPPAAPPQRAAPRPEAAEREQPEPPAPEPQAASVAPEPEPEAPEPQAAEPAAEPAPQPQAAQPAAPPADETQVTLPAAPPEPEAPAPAAAAPPPPPELPPVPEPPPPPAAETVARAAPGDAASADVAGAALDAAAVAPGTTITLPFGPDAAALPPAAQDELASIAEAMAADEELQIKLDAFAGGADLSASQARRLSLSRAIAVQGYLKARGVESRRIFVLAHGDKAADGPKNRVDVQVVER